MLTLASARLPGTEQTTVGGAMQQTNPYQPQFPPKRRPNNAVLVRVGESAFTYEQIAERLCCTVVQAQGKVRRIRDRKTNNQVTWESLGQAGAPGENRD
jgi:hypothetical protein